MNNLKTEVLARARALAERTRDAAIDAARPEFITADGADLIYKGQPVHLRGVNFNNILALKVRREDKPSWGSGDTDDINVGEADYAALAALGGNHARWGMSFNWWKDDRANFFAVMNQHIAWAKQNGLWLIPVLFTLPGDCYEGYNYNCPFWADGAQQDKFVAFWVDVAEHYKDEPTIAGYDLLNEPTPPGPDYSWAWFPVAQRARDAIAEVDPNHLVFIECNSSGKFGGHIFDGDNIVYSIHMYYPLDITHSLENTTLVYPGEIYNRAHLEATLPTKYAIQWAADNGKPSYAGEFGARDWVSGNDGYMEDVLSLFNEWGLHYAYFVWREQEPEGFGLYPIEDSFEPWDAERLQVVRDALGVRRE